MSAMPPTRPSVTRFDQGRVTVLQASPDFFRRPGWTRIVERFLDFGPQALHHFLIAEVPVHPVLEGLTDEVAFREELSGLDARADHLGQVSWQGDGQRLELCHGQLH